MIGKLFSPFSLEKRIPQGSIGGGHDVYVLRKPMVDTKVMLLDSFKNLELISDRLGTSWSLKFDSADSDSSKGKKLRIFCTGGAPGIYLTEVGSVVKIRNHDKVVTEEKSILSTGSQFYGDTQWSMVEVRIPPALSGKITVEIESTPSNSSYLRSVRWMASQIL